MTPDVTSKSQYKVDYLSSVVNHGDNFVPFVFLTETWCKSYMTDAQLNINHYSVHRADRKLRKKGGAIIYVHEMFEASESLRFDNKYVEVVLLHIDDIKTTLVCVYRPPNCPLQKFKEAIDFIVQNLNKEDDWTIIMAGDFNFPIINWDSLTLNSGYTIEEQESALLFLEMKSQKLISQYVHAETRISSEETGNILDLFLTNNPDLVLDISTEDTTMSDHKVVSIDLCYDLLDSQSALPSEHSLKNNPTENISFSQLNFTNANFDEINARLKNINWDKLKEENPEKKIVEVFYRARSL